MDNEDCGKPVRWVVRGINYGPVYLCKEHHVGREIMKLVDMGLLKMEECVIDERGWRCQVIKRKGREKDLPASKRILFG